MTKINKITRRISKDLQEAWDVISISDVKALRQCNWISLPVVAVLLVSWLFASNHCAFGRIKVADPVVAEHSCCHKEDAAKSTPGRSIQCCDSLSVPLPVAVIAPVGDLVAIKPAWPVGVLEAILDNQSRQAVSEFSSSGPPRAISFSELVLCCSLPAHGPPVVVS